MHRDFLAIPDFSAQELGELFQLADTMRRGQYTEHPLAGKSLAMIFMKSSTRTRVSLRGGRPGTSAATRCFSRRATFSSVAASRSRDTARVLSRYVDGIMIRTFGHAEVEELAQYATVPVINGLTDLLHPCQVLADLLTVLAALGGVRRASASPGSATATTWPTRGSRRRIVSGFDLRLACPEGYDPDAKILARAQATAGVKIVRDLAEAVDGADVVNTDVWASMGQEEEQERRMRAFAGFTVTSKLMAKAKRDAIFLHCLPAHRGEEVAADVIDGPQSRVWDQAENRLHVQKAVMAILMAGNKQG